MAKDARARARAHARARARPLPSVSRVTGQMSLFDHFLTPLFSKGSLFAAEIAKKVIF